MEEQYSLWICPSGNVKEEFKKIIDHLSVTYDSPSFNPHLTLLGNIKTSKEEMLDKAKQLSEQIKSFPISISEISFSTTYFQSVFARVKSTASLMNANLKAKDIYKEENNVFMPHISLMYGDHSMEDRERISQTINISPISFMANNIMVVPSAGTISAWTSLAEFSFSY